MRELIVAHLSNGTSLANMRLFLRTLHRSGASARTDGVVLFPRDYCGSKQVWEVFQEDEASFQRILALSDPETIANRRASGGPEPLHSFAISLYSLHNEGFIFRSGDST